MLETRYLSPEREVTFCGHATIATGVALGEGDPALGLVRLATRAGVVRWRPSAGAAPTSTLTAPVVASAGANHLVLPSRRARCSQACATGSRTCAPSCWSTAGRPSTSYGVDPRCGVAEAPIELTVVQGVDMGRPSTIRVGIPADRPGIDVTGTAVRMA